MSCCAVAGAKAYSPPAHNSHSTQLLLDCELVGIMRWGTHVPLSVSVFAATRSTLTGTVEHAAGYGGGMPAAAAAAGQWDPYSQPQPYAANGAPAAAAYSQQQQMAAAYQQQQYAAYYQQAQQTAGGWRR